MVLEQSTTSAGSIPNAELARVEWLASIAQLVDPTATLAVGETDEGGFYFHLGSSKRLFDYLIEPSSEGGWVGTANGLLGLIPSFSGPTAGLVATLAAMGLGNRLVQLGIDAAGALLLGG